MRAELEKKPDFGGACTCKIHHHDTRVLWMVARALLEDHFLGYAVARVLWVAKSPTHKP